MNASSYGSTMTSGIVLSAGESPAPAKAPKALIATRAVQMKDGWVGQLFVAEEVVWESDPQETADDAEQAATARVLKRVKKLLG